MCAFFIVGMASESFAFDENGAFYLVPGISIEAITPDSLLRYSKEIMFTGTCCKALNKLSTPNLETGRYRYEGYVYTVSDFILLLIIFDLKIDFF